MERLPTDIPAVMLLKPRVFEDERGFFLESFNQRSWCETTGLDTRFVQDNHSRSTRGVLRGLHYQLPPAGQGKLIRVLLGEIFDVAVDLRPDSPTFGRWTGQTLSAANRLQLWVPEGFAHGFMVTSEVAEVFYKTTDYYAPQFERAIRWDDPTLAIDWPAGIDPVLSAKDRTAGAFASAEYYPTAR